MRGGAAHAGKDLLHGEAATGHGAEHPVFGLEGLRFQRFEVGRFGDSESALARSERVGSESNGAIGYHGAFHPAGGDIGTIIRKFRLGLCGEGRQLAGPALSLRKRSASQEFGRGSCIHA